MDAVTILLLILALGVLIWGGPNVVGIKRRKKLIGSLRKRDDEHRPQP